MRPMDRAMPGDLHETPRHVTRTPLPTHRPTFADRAWWHGIDALAWLSGACFAVIVHLPLVGPTLRRRVELFLGANKETHRG